MAHYCDSGMYNSSPLNVVVRCTHGERCGAVTLLICVSGVRCVRTMSNGVFLLVICHFGRIQASSDVLARGLQKQSNQAKTKHGWSPDVCWGIIAQAL